MMRSGVLAVAGAVFAAASFPELASAQAGAAGAAQQGYLTPPDPIPQIVTAPSLPRVSVSPDGQRLALLAREALPGVAELAEPELRLAGVRLNPRTGGPSRQSYLTGLAFERIADGSRQEVELPAGARLSDPSWSPDGSRLAFTNTTAGGIELWVADAAEGSARRVLGPRLNAVLGTPFHWLPDGSGLVAALVPEGRGVVPAAPAVPTGPLIQQNLGRAAPARTYQDLLETPHDADLFEHYATAQLARVPLDGGPPVALGDPAIVRDFGPSPDGRFLLVESVHRPFSYLVPLSRFPTRIAVLDAQGRTAHELADLPLADEVPTAFDAVPTGPREVQWRSDAPATLAWVEALDGGDPRMAAEVRDRVLLLPAPFTGTPQTLVDLSYRFADVDWGRDDFALVYSRWWETRGERRYAVQPGRSSSEPRLLEERSYQDRYGDPGVPETTPNAAGFPVLLFSADGGHIYLTGEGASSRGNYPFLDRMDIQSGETERLWRNEDPYFETVVAVLDPEGARFLTRRETVTDPPNYFLHERGGGEPRRLTDFADPAPQFAGVQREIVTYPRADGVMLSATLYTPPGYDAARDGPLPMLMWAYPREFRDASDAAQLDDSPNRFSRPEGASHLLLLTLGYAVLDGPAMPIIGAGEEEPNDTYIEQLVADAKAAVDKVVEMGVARPGHIAIGGHSYGAFMTANLLAHSDLFAAGIARSGAYNRTLTPFGFQAEQRTYWEAPEIYYAMSPFMHAEQVNEPILLIHGAADNNSGTFPIQSERFYAALKGMGATVRYVVLPHESHGYRGRENVLHTLAEMAAWMDGYVKPRDASASAPSTPTTRRR